MRRRLLSIGVNSYRNLSPLSYAVKDSTAVYELMIDARYGACDTSVSRLLLNPDKAELERELEIFVSAAEFSDQIIIYYAGHGQLSKDLGLYVCAVDSRPELLASSSTPLEFLDSVFRWSACKRTLLLLDCCFGGAAFKGTKYRGFGGPNGALDKVSGRGRIVISGSDQLQPSRELATAEHGLFTHHFLSGVRSGVADYDSDGSISTSDIFRYTYEKVSEDSNGQQRPVYSGIDVEGDFYVAHNPSRQFSRITTQPDMRDMVIVPSSRFCFGERNEEVEIPSFYMDIYPVTNRDYLRFVEATGHRAPRQWTNGAVPNGLEDHPVVFVDYEDALRFAVWAGKRLPTTLEWEKAARGEKGYRYPWGHAPTVAKCNVRESGVGTATPVTKYRSGVSPFGVYDMAGNAWEWCATETAPNRRMLRGGSFNTPFEHAVGYMTNDASETMMDDDTGFRCVLDLADMESRKI